MKGVVEPTSTLNGDTGAGPVGGALTAKTSVHNRDTKPNLEALQNLILRSIKNRRRMGRRWTRRERYYSPQLVSRVCTTGSRQACGR